MTYQIHHCHYLGVMARNEVSVHTSQKCVVPMVCIITQKGFWRP